MPLRARTYIGASVTSTPSSRTRPESGAVSPTTIEKVVVLPAPLAPSSPITSPDAISTLTPLTTVRPLYDLVRSRVRNVDIQKDPSAGHEGSVRVVWPFVLFPLAVVALNVWSNTSVVPSVILQL